MFWMIRGENSTKQSFVLEFGASELRLESFCVVLKTQQQNSELPLHASEQDSLIGPAIK